MALIGKIRKNMWLVIVLLAVALAGFILMDMQSASSRGSFGSPNAIGKVAGEKIDYMEFQKAESALYGGSGDVYGRRSSLWNYFVEKNIIDDIASDNGIDVGSDELAELEFGNNLSPVVQGYYRNPQTGQVDRAQLAEIKTAIDGGTVTNPEFANRFNELRKQVIKTAKQTKLSNLVAKAIYEPAWYNKTLETINNEFANFEFVKVPFDYITDDQVSLTDEDYTKYINANAVKYTNKEEVRNLSYIVYDVLATLEDSTELRTKLTELTTDFANAKNDSLFVITNEGFYNPNYSNKTDLPTALQDIVGTLSTGQISSIYVDNNSYAVAKLIDRKVLADSAKASHILRTVEGGNPDQLAMATKYIDSLKTAIKSGSVSFAEAARNNSQDPGSAAQDGDLGQFAPGSMVPQFNDAVFNGKEGDIHVVTTQFGVHLIKVAKLTYKTNELKYKLAYLAKSIIPSEKTQNAILDKVMAGLENTKKIDDLQKLSIDGVKLEIVGSIKKNDFTFGNLGGGQTSRDIIRWAYDAQTKVGDVSATAYTYTDENNYVDSKYAVVGLKSIDKPGLATVESLRSTIEPLVRAEKKAEMIKSKMGNSDLASVAASFGLESSLANNISFGRAIMPDGSSEPIVIAKTFKLAPGTKSEPIVGKAGVYVVKLNSITPSSTDGIAQQKASILNIYRSQVNAQLMEALKKSYKIEDNRSTYF